MCTSLNSQEDYFRPVIVPNFADTKVKILLIERSASEYLHVIFLKVGLTN
jgi:hypothetical protein